MTTRSMIERTSLALVAVGMAAACGRSEAPAAPAVPAAPVVAAPAATPIQWNTNATQYRAQTGQQITVSCPANGTANTVWGTDIYSDDSSICTAALHSGRVTLQAGGVVTIQIAPGAPSYTPTSRNGVETRPWGAWSGSFTIVGGPAPGLTATPVGAAAPPVPGAPRTVEWSTDGADVVQTGQTALVGCPPGGVANSVWGTDTYSSDSSVCTAAVHAGLIQLATGGVVSVTGVAGLSAYPASTRNGVTTSSWGSWGSSFTVAPAAGGAAPAPANK